jgi:hypothetical protein
MPRKQRFKPSRKPQAAQVSASSPHVDDRKEIKPEQSVGPSAPVSELAPTSNLEHK